MLFPRPPFTWFVEVGGTLNSLRLPPPLLTAYLLPWTELTGTEHTERGEIPEGVVATA